MFSVESYLETSGKAVHSSSDGKQKQNINQRSLILREGVGYVDGFHKLIGLVT
jgi:hypothetical protein